MKKVVSVFIVILLFLAECSVSLANTSFAVYSDKTIYGVNFDINETDVRFRIVKDGDRRTFLLDYSGVRLYYGKGYLPTVSMNDQGLFASSHIHLPAPDLELKQTAKALEIGDLTIESTDKFQTVDQIIERIGKNNLVNSDISIHTLFADKNGKALIAEATEGGKVSALEDNFVVMTDTTQGQASESGISNDPFITEDKKRYQTAYDTILKNKDKFGIEEGFEVLKKTTQSWRGGGTLCSLVFDADQGDVYIAVGRKFDKIWKVNIAAGTIETWKGFTGFSSYGIGTGLSLDDIVRPKGFFERYGLYIAAAVLILAWIVAGTLLRRRAVKRFKPKPMEW